MEEDPAPGIIGTDTTNNRTSRVDTRYVWSPGSRS